MRRARCAIEPGVPAIVTTHRHPRYTLTLRICADDHADVIHVEARLDDPRDVADPDRLAHPLRLYPLLAPHLGFSGLHNSAWTGTYKGRAMLFAGTGPSALALASEPGPARQSVGYVGASDGWQDFAANGRMAWTYAVTEAGNVAGMTELVLADGVARLALGFGTRPEEAGLEACAALAGHFENAWDEYVGNWHGFLRTVSRPPAHVPEEDRDLYLTSAAVLRTHADRTAPGAIVASLSIPWGNTRNDLGGYHLVWSRDLVESAGALVALGAGRTARRTLAYLVATQEPDGSWVQNQWVDGVAYWSGVQLDEAAYPILLAGALRRGGAAEMHGMAGSDAQAFEHLLTEDALERMITVCRALHRPDRPRDRAGSLGGERGLTPSTLAPVVAALVVASITAEPAATYCGSWPTTGTPRSRSGPTPAEPGSAGSTASTAITSGSRRPTCWPAPGSRRPSRCEPAARASMVPADEMVGTDFLALVRFGLRMADDPRILATLAVTDALLRTRRRAAGLAPLQRGRLRRARGRERLDGTGIGRAGRCWSASAATTSWRRDATHAVPRGDAPDGVSRRDAARAGLGRGADPRPRPRSGRPSGSAMPLAWAHAEYVKLLRSIALGHAIDRPAAAWHRYHGVAPAATRATWRFTAPRPTGGRPTAADGAAGPGARSLVRDDWRTWADLDARDTGVGVWVVDVPGSDRLPPGGAVDFTFWWPEAERWEGRGTPRDRRRGRAGVSGSAHRGAASVPGLAASAVATEAAVAGANLASLTPPQGAGRRRCRRPGLTAAQSSRAAQGGWPECSRRRAAPDQGPDPRQPVREPRSSSSSWPRSCVCIAVGDP